MIIPFKEYFNIHNSTDKLICRYEILFVLPSRKKFEFAGHNYEQSVKCVGNALT